MYESKCDEGTNRKLCMENRLEFIDDLEKCRASVNHCKPVRSRISASFMTPHLPYHSMCVQVADSGFLDI